MNKKIEGSKKLGVLITLPPDLCDWVRSQEASNSDVCWKALELYWKVQTGKVKIEGETSGNH